MERSREDYRAIIAERIASGFVGSRRIVAPGTVGSIVALCFWYFLSFFHILEPGFPSILLVLLTTSAGLWGVQIVLEAENDPDPSWVVIDEWAGLFLSLAWTNVSPFLVVCLAFILFRLLDITKVGPVAWAERLPGGLGVMADDLVAGAITASIVWLVVGVVQGLS